MEPSDIVSTFSVLTPCKICLCALFFSPSFCLQVHLLLFPSTLFHDLQLLLRSSPSNTNSTLSGLYLFCFLFFFFFALTTFSFMGRRAKRSREMENIFNCFSVSICHTAQTCASTSTLSITHVSLFTKLHDTCVPTRQVPRNSAYLWFQYQSKS